MKLAQRAAATERQQELCLDLLGHGAAEIDTEASRGFAGARGTAIGTELEQEQKRSTDGFWSLIGSGPGLKPNLSRSCSTILGRQQQTGTELFC